MPVGSLGTRGLRQAVITETLLLPLPPRPIHRLRHLSHFARSPYQPPHFPAFLAFSVLMIELIWVLIVFCSIFIATGGIRLSRSWIASSRCTVSISALT